MERPYLKAADLHRPGVTIMGVAGTATIRSAEKAAGGAQVLGAASLAEATEAFAAGRCEALALGRLALKDLARRTPGVRIAEGNFHLAETAVVVPRGAPSGALEAASELVRRMKADGTVAESFRRHGMADAVIPD